MTLLDDDTSSVHVPHRTWRDLPASPPVADLPPPTLAPTQAMPAVGTEADASVGMLPPPPPPPAPNSRRRRWGLVAIVTALVVASAGTVAVVAWGDDGTASATTPVLPSSASGNPADIAAALGPAVVQIELDGGIGSGVIADTSGLILTAHHVVATGDEVTVRTADDRELTGRVVGRLPDRDLAIVSVDGAENLVAAPIAEPGSVEVGEMAIALGSPYGYQASVTAGIISGLDRDLETPVGTLTGLIQTDAPINPGNSGGPLADAEARVIGINTAIASMSGGNDGVGFAVPVEDFATLLDEVQANGGAAAPTVPAPEGAGPFGGIPGLGDIPGLGEIPGLDDILPELGEIPELGEFPGLDDMLDDLYEQGDIPEELQQLLDEMFGVDGSKGADDGTGAST